MAIPGSSSEVDYGIRLAWSPNLTDSEGNPCLPQTEIQRTLGVAAPATSAWSTIVYARAGSTQYDDLLASDGIRRWYRIRHRAPGYEPSTWLGNVDAKPTELP